MANLIVKNFDDPDETRSPPKVTLQLCDLGIAKVAKLTAQPGWKWSEHIKPLVNTEWCEKKHVGILVSGTMHVKMSDGTERDIEAGSTYVIEPNHDGWVVGDEPLVAYEFEAETAKSWATNQN